jgi:uncharacterized protein
MYIISPLMQTRLPEKFNVWKLGTTRCRWQGTLSLAQTPRLTSLLSATQGSVAVELETGVDEQNIRFIAGHLEVTVEMICQRCMVPMHLPIVADLRLGALPSEARLDELPEDYEPLLVPEGEVRIADLVEDELILALPLVPKHQHLRQCEANGFEWPGQPQPPEKTNPFTNLASLLDDLKKEQ